MLPKAVRDLSQELMRLPGIGPKTAQRLSIHLLRQPRSIVAQLADILKNLHANVRLCARCFNLAEDELCVVCRNDMRSDKLLCVVEDSLDVEAIERTNTYTGRYHVLGGVLSPLEGVGPEQLTLKELATRLADGVVTELILALDHNMESEATIRHIMAHMPVQDIHVTRLARGLPTGGDIEFADTLTLSAALSGRKQL